jgi:hypothetical protein
MFSVFPLMSPFTRLAVGVQPPCAKISAKKCSDTWNFPPHDDAVATCVDTCSNTSSSGFTGFADLDSIDTCSNTSSECTDHSFVCAEASICSMSTSSAGSEFLHTPPAPRRADGGTGQSAMQIYSSHLAEVRVCEEQDNAANVVRRLLDNFSCTMQNIIDTTLQTAGTSERLRVEETCEHKRIQDVTDATINDLQHRVDEMDKGYNAGQMAEISVTVDVSKFPEWWMRLITYRECDGEDPIPPWVVNVDIDIPEQYRDMYCEMWD